MLDISQRLILALKNGKKAVADAAKPKSLAYILLDSVIIAAIAMFACSPSGIPTSLDLWVMLKAFLGAFIVELAIERGLKKKPA